LQEARVFDLPHYRALDEARTILLQEILPEWKREWGFQTALDAGCGVGHFSGLMRDLGFEVVAFDGRQDNSEEAGRRFPGIRFQVADIEDPAVQSLGSFDLVLCMGLLYHLENPFRCIRNLRGLTGKLLLIESMCMDDSSPVLHLRDEGPTEDQGLRHVAFYPSESCLAKMLYRVGFSTVWRLARLPAHADFHASRARHRVRTMLAASSSLLESRFLLRIPEPVNIPDPWTTGWARAMQPVHRLGHFMAKPWPDKLAALRRRMGRSENGTGNGR
jgi:SAM-dependent methyltransferase